MGTIVTFLIIAGLGVLAYAIFRKRIVPVGHIGVLTFMGTRTSFIFGEGVYFLPFFCDVIHENVMDAKMELLMEDAAASDGVNIVFKRTFIRYRLKQVPRAQGSSSRFKFPFIRRFVPYRMGDTLAEYLNVRGVIDESMRATAQGAISLFMATVSHAKVLGYHVVQIVDQLLAGKTVEEMQTLTEEVQQTRARLKAVVKDALEEAFAYAGIEVMNVAFTDIDPTAEDKAHIKVAIRELQKQQLEKIRTSTEVKRTLAVAEAVHQFKAQHPEADFMAIYKIMRELDNQKSAADGSGLIGLIGQAVLAKLTDTSVTAPAPSIVPVPA